MTDTGEWVLYFAGSYSQAVNKNLAAVFLSSYFPPNSYYKSNMLKIYSKSNREQIETGPGLG